MLSVRGIVIVLGFVILSLCVNASIFIDESDIEDYNIGDEINFSFSVEESLPIVEAVDVYLVCDDDEELIFKEFRNFKEDSIQEFDLYSVANEEGECHFKVIFGDKDEETKDFEITSTLDYFAILNSKVFQPGDEIIINGSVDKLNSHKFNYSAIVSLGTIYKNTFSFHEKDFAISFTLDSDVPSGEYNLNINFEEVDVLGDVINDAHYGESIEVLPKPSSIRIQTSEEFTPPHDLSIIATLLDQSEKAVYNESVFLKIYDLENDLFYEEVIDSGNEVKINFPSDSTIGGWRVNAYYANINTIKPIYVKENEDISVDFENGSSYLKVRNIGNVPYLGVLEVSLENGEEAQDIIFNLSLDLNESEEVNLRAEGGFNLSVGEREFKNVFITGAAIFENERLNYIAIVLSIILVIVLIISFYIVRKNIKKYKDEKGESKQSQLHSFLPSKQGGVSFNKVKVESPEKFEENSQKVVEPEKRLYSLFFGIDEAGDLKKIKPILNKYSLKVYQMGDMYFTLLKSSKSPENRLVNLSKMVIEQTHCEKIFVHSVNLEDAKSIYSMFSVIRGIFKEYSGVIISESVYAKLSSKNNLTHLKDITFKENLIKLFSL